MGIGEWLFGDGDDTGIIGTGHYRNKDRHDVDENAFKNDSYDGQTRYDLQNRRGVTDARKAQTIDGTQIAANERAAAASAGKAATAGPAAQSALSQAGNSRISRAEDGQMRARQSGLMDELEKQMQGQGAAQKLIDLKYKQGTEDTRKGMMGALSAGGSGMNAAQQARMIADQSAATGAANTRQAAQDKLQAQADAQNMYGNLATQTRGQDIGVASDQAHMDQDVNLANMSEAGTNSRFNAGARNEQRQFDAGQLNEFANAEANRRQQANIFNAEQSNLTNRDQAQMDMETKKTNLESYYRQMGMNDEMARYYTDQIMAGDEANRQARMQREQLKTEQDIAREKAEAAAYDSAAQRKSGASAGIIGSIGSFASGAMGSIFSDERVKENKNPVSTKSQKYSDAEVKAAMDWNARMDKMKMDRENMSKNSSVSNQERATSAFGSMFTQPLMEMMKPSNADGITAEQNYNKQASRGISEGWMRPNSNPTTPVLNNNTSAISVPSSSGGNGASSGGGKALSSFDFKTLIKSVKPTSYDTSKMQSDYAGVDRRDWKGGGMNVMGPFEKYNDEALAMSGGGNPGERALAESRIIPTGKYSGNSGIMSDEKEKMNVNVVSGNPAAASPLNPAATSSTTTAPKKDASAGGAFGDQSQPAAAPAQASTAKGNGTTNIYIGSAQDPTAQRNAGMPWETKSDDGSAKWNRRANLVDALVGAQGPGYRRGEMRERPSTTAFNQASKENYLFEQDRLAAAERDRLAAEAEAREQARIQAENDRLAREREAAEAAERAKEREPVAPGTRPFGELARPVDQSRFAIDPAILAEWERQKAEAIAEAKRQKEEAERKAMQERWEREQFEAQERLYAAANPGYVPKEYKSAEQKAADQAYAESEDKNRNGIPDYMEHMLSDERQKTEKKNVGDKDVSDFIAALEPYTYNYKDPGMQGAAKGKQLGIMAQDLEKSKIGKNMVSEDEKGVKMVDTPHLTTANTALIKLQDERQNKLDERLANLEEVFKMKKGKR